MSISILQGDALTVLQTLPAQSVHCCVTSPPYWGLRDYGVEGQLGLEPTPDDYVAQMVAVFAEVRRVLRDDGTLWLNIGDSYAGSWQNYGGGNRGVGKQRPISKGSSAQNPVWEGLEGWRPPASKKLDGIKPKDLVGVPWLLAFALRADDWYLRQDIIWSKPNAMPESVTDRCTKSHEYIFLLSKSERYYYNQDAIAEPVKPESIVRAEAGVAFGGKNLCPDTRLQSGNEWKPKAVGENSRINKSRDPDHEREYNGKKSRTVGIGSNARPSKAAPSDAGGVDRNKRSVWTVPTFSYRQAHFATFPPKLIEPCILAGCPEGGTVLDPFFGSGTTGIVADKNGCNCIGIELNPKYIRLAKKRLAQRSLLTAQEQA